MILFAFFFGDWPQLLGPTRNGVYTATDVAWPSKIAWKKQVGAGFAGPIIADGKVILFHRRGAEEGLPVIERTHTGKQAPCKMKYQAQHNTQKYHRTDSACAPMIRRKR